MKIALLDVDSTIPNLALMRLSAWHKSQGHEVEWFSPLLEHTYDEIFASKIFDFSDGSAIPPRAIVGGTGSGSARELPPEVEAMAPDYSLYGWPHNLGFTMRGCRLRCSFCVVPEKEGRAHGVATIDELYTQRDSDFLVLLDNDFFGNPAWRDRIDEIQRFGLRVNFNQGLNIRNLKPDQAAALASVEFRSSSGKSKIVTFAWDDPRHEKLIHKGIRIATNAGVPAHAMQFYVLIGYHSTPAEDMHRVQTLLDYGASPFAMPYDRTDPYQRDFARWVNGRLCKTVPWSEYHGPRAAKARDDRTIPLLDLG